MPSGSPGVVDAARTALRPTFNVPNELNYLADLVRPIFPCGEWGGVRSAGGD
jgi:hypothetical protein